MAAVTNASNLLFALDFRRVLDLVQTRCRLSGSLLAWTRVGGRLLRAQGEELQLAVSLLGGKETFFRWVRFLKVKRRVTADRVSALYWGYLVPCPHLYCSPFLLLAACSPWLAASLALVRPRVKRDSLVWKKTNVTKK